TGSESTGGSMPRPYQSRRKRRWTHPGRRAQTRPFSERGSRMTSAADADSSVVRSAQVGRDGRATVVTLVVNGVVRNVELEPRVSLLDALREHLQLTGSKKGC